MRKRDEFGRWAVVWAVASGALLVGCGTGGGDEEADAPPPVRFVDETTTTTTTTPTPPGLTWRFHLVTAERWEYDVVYSVAFDASFDKDVSQSPPGKARFVARTEGRVEVTVTPTIPGRTAPTISFGEAVALFELPDRFDFTDSRLAPTAQCRVPGYPYDAAIGTQTGFRCTVKTLAARASDDNDEAVVDQAVGILKGQEPKFYVTNANGTGGDCELVLMPDGKVRTHYSEATYREFPRTCRVEAV